MSYSKGFIPHNSLKTMINEELNLEQLVSVAGGAPHITDYTSIRFASRRIIHPNYKSCSFDIGPIGRRGFDVGPVARNSRISAEPLPSPAPVGVYEYP